MAEYYTSSVKHRFAELWQSNPLEFVLHYKMTEEQGIIFWLLLYFAPETNTFHFKWPRGHYRKPSSRTVWTSFFDLWVWMYKKLGLLRCFLRFSNSPIHSRSNCNVCGPWTKMSLSAKAYHNRTDWILCTNLILDKLVPFTIEQRRLMEEECSVMCFCLKKVLVIVSYHWCTCGIYLACTLTETKINETSLKPPHVKYFIMH